MKARLKAICLIIACVVCAIGSTAPSPPPLAETLEENCIPIHDWIRRDHFVETLLIPELDNNPSRPRFARGGILVKWNHQPRVMVYPTLPGTETTVMQALKTVDGVQFAELDILQNRQWTPNDPEVGRQWHHQKIGSTSAWASASKTGSIRIALIDEAFQTDHEDLSPHVLPGWNIIEEKTISSSSGIDHSTLSAGLISALIDNGLGVAGIAECRLVPVEVTGFTSDIYAAILWAADQGIRIVNASWSGSDSETLAEAGSYLRKTSDGMLFMSGVNGSGYLDYPNHPDLYAISMTDESDQIQSRHGPHIDLSAPGYRIYSTMTGSKYGTASGSSFSASIAAASAAMIMGINPKLDSKRVFEIMQLTARDRGPAGYDPFYGWGRINLASAVDHAYKTLPNLEIAIETTGTLVLSTQTEAGFTYTLESSLFATETEWVAEQTRKAERSGPVTFRLPLKPGTQIQLFRIVMR